MASLVHQTNTLLSELAYPLADTLNLPHLPQHFPALIYSFLGWVLLHRVVSPVLSARLCPESYGKLRTARAVNNWNIQVVSFLHVFVVVPLAVRCLALENLNEDKINGWDERLGTAVAVACGYFLWDCVDALVNFDDAGFLLHGVSCLIIYGGIFRPFLGHYACRFLSWELSTIFLNIHRFLDKTGRTGGTAQFINGAALLGTFFCARIAWGWYKTFDLYQTLYAARHEVPLVYLVLYGCGSSALHSLNAVWFYKMVRALRKRFDADQPRKVANEKVASGNTANGHAANGHAAKGKVE